MAHITHKNNSKINALPNGPRRIIYESLKLDPTKRWKIADIITDPWYLQKNPLFDHTFMVADPEVLIQLIRQNSSTQMLS